MCSSDLARPGDAPDTITDLVAVAEGEATDLQRRHGADLVIDLPHDGASCRVRLTPSTAHIILGNLLRNAAEAQRGCGRIAINVAAPGVLVVANPGRLPGSATLTGGGSGGLGLGLTLCRRLLAEASGSLDLRQVAHTVEAEVRLPAADPAPAGPP